MRDNARLPGLLPRGTPLCRGLPTRAPASDWALRHDSPARAATRSIASIASVASAPREPFDAFALRVSGQPKRERAPRGRSSTGRHRLQRRSERQHPGERADAGASRLRSKPHRRSAHVRATRAVPQRAHRLRRARARLRLLRDVRVWPVPGRALHASDHAPSPRYPPSGGSARASRWTGAVHEAVGSGPLRRTARCSAHERLDVHGGSRPRRARAALRGGDSKRVEGSLLVSDVGGLRPLVPGRSRLLWVSLRLPARDQRAPPRRVRGELREDLRATAVPRRRLCLSACHVRRVPTEPLCRRANPGRLVSATPRTRARSGLA